MIWKIHKHRRFVTKLELAFSFVMFLILTYLFFFVFLNICFESIVSNPSIPVLAIVFLIMVSDIVMDAYFSGTVLATTVLLNTAIMIFLIASLYVDNVVIFFFSATILLRLPEIVLWNDIIRDQLKGKHKTLFKIYIIAKILYMMALLGHITGCLFYLLDQTLIRY